MRGKERDGEMEREREESYRERTENLVEEVTAETSILKYRASHVKA